MERAQRSARSPAPRESPAARGPEPPLPPPPPIGPPLEAPVVDRGAARPGRLTPDERRALRQQINEAGRDVYRPVHP